MALRVITWPIGFIVVAKNRQLIFIGVDLAYTLVNVSLAWVCVGHFGLNGAGIAFFGSNLFRGLLVYSTARALSGFRWSAANRKTGVVFLGSIALVFCSLYLLPPLWAAVLGGIATAVSGLYSLHTVLTLLSTDRIPQRVRQCLEWLRFDPQHERPKYFSGGQGTQ
jgi:PST family polysaccharide transporter